MQHSSMSHRGCGMDLIPWGFWASCLNLDWYQHYSKSALALSGGKSHLEGSRCLLKISFLWWFSFGVGNFQWGENFYFRFSLAFCLQDVSIRAPEFKYLTLNKNKIVFQKQILLLLPCCHVNLSENSLNTITYSRHTSDTPKHSVSDFTNP